MNLHIVPDNVFINKFYDNLRELGLEKDNKIIVRTQSKKLKYIKHSLPFAPLYSSEFGLLAGDTTTYDKVFIHQFTPLLYRWVATNKFRELNWMVWGSDLYNLPSVEAGLYEPLTFTRYIKNNFSLQKFLYQTKVFILHSRFRKEAYEKVDNVLTWMKSEYEFALEHIPNLQANHRFFFYENELPYQAMDEVLSHRDTDLPRLKPVYVLGNSSTPELNHLDAVQWMQSEGVEADLWVPVSYGDANYKRFLKKNLAFYRGGEVRYFEKYITFQDYMRLLNGADGLIMNNIRPQGYGNILMMMYLGKKIFLNDKNISTRELDEGGLIWEPLRNMKFVSNDGWNNNKAMVGKLLSHEILLKTYKELFL